MSQPPSNYRQATYAEAEDVYDVAVWRADIQDWELRGYDFATPTEAMDRVAAMRRNRPHRIPNNYRPVRVQRSTKVVELKEQHDV